MTPSRTFESKGVQLMLRQSPRDSGAGTLGMTTVVSTFQALGHLPVEKTVLKILVTAGASSG